MNEWSPGGSYSRPATPTGRFRSQRKEFEKEKTPQIVNTRTVSETRNRSFQQHSMENVSKSFVSTNKTKKEASGNSDPRFKRVICPGAQNDACVGTEVKNSKPSLSLQETFKPKEAVWEAKEIKTNPSDGSSPENTGSVNAIVELCDSERPECENVPVEEPYNVDQSEDHLKVVDKLSFNHDITVKSFSKESLSDCTVNTRTTSLASEDVVDEFSSSIYPSATRVKKVQKWIHDQKPKPDKKQSVVTVIGQTQGRDTFSSALEEIDKRKKLVKKLDKYAVCKKVTDSDKDKEISELVAKINFLSRVGRIMFPQKKTGDESNLLTKGSGDKTDICVEPLENAEVEKLLNLSNDGSPEIKASTALSRKRSSSRKKPKKSHSECLIKGKVGEWFDRTHSKWIFWFLVVLGGAMCWFAFFSIQNGAYVSFDLFSQKPKPLTWYEKICMWIWEVFRPSNSYRRVTPWHAY